MTEMELTQAVEQAFNELVARPAGDAGDADDLVSEFLAWESCMSPELSQRWKAVIADKLAVPAEGLREVEQRLRELTK
jgi:hypothetical protein